MPTGVRDVSVWLDALAGSHDQLVDLVGELDEQGLQTQSYCDDWTIAQVLAHIGSGAEILGKTVDAVVAGEDPPSREVFPEIWARWNAMGPRQVTEEALAASGEFVEKLEHLGDALEDHEFTLFGVLRVDAIGLLWVRLSEHALHTWDVAVALDPRAVVDPDAVTLLLDRLPQATARFAKPDRADVARPFAVRVVISGPDREFDLEVGDDVTMTPVEDGAAPYEVASAAGDGRAPALLLHLPAEAFLRLVYGRLDASHASVVAVQDRTTLDTLRKIFPGF